MPKPASFALPITVTVEVEGGVADVTSVEDANGAAVPFNVIIDDHDEPGDPITDETHCHCQNCKWVGTYGECAPPDGLEDDTCPECGSRDVFPDHEEYDP